MNYIDIKKSSECCGCRACANICPKNAITMVPNEEGFLYPVIDMEKCIDCGLCRKICPWINQVHRNGFFDTPRCYAAKAKDKSIQKSSSSGGMFGVLANHILNSNGVVFGARMFENLEVHFDKAETADELVALKESKYVSSNTNHIFREIKEKLDSDKLVLFCGLPCQVSGLKNFLRKDYYNLITAEVICHGVPAQKAFEKYITYLEDKYKAKVKEYRFRSKEAASWGTYKALCTFLKDGKEFKKKINADFDPYYNSFLYSKNCRESCYECKFANQKRNADFTLGDFWGIEKLMPDMIDYDGVSVLVVNSEKASHIFDTVKEALEFKEVPYDVVCKNNGQLVFPAKRPEERDVWYKLLEQGGYKSIKLNKNLRSYVKIFFPQKLKFKIKKYLKKR